MSTGNPVLKYDVAISFLNNDVGIAKGLTDLLSPQVRVFFFVDRQAELAGTDGLESFRRAFRFESRLVVLLYREEWGETDWTRIEKQAIEERFLKEGPTFLFLIMLISGGKPPVWYPANHIRFNMDDYGLNQAAGAIKLRLSDFGVGLQKESLIDHARKAHDLASHDAETRRLRHCEDGVRQVEDEAKHLVADIKKHVVEIKDAEPEFKIELSASDSTHITIVQPRASLVVWLDNHILNSLNNAKLKILIYRQRLILPGENRVYSGGDPSETLNTALNIHPKQGQS